MKKTTKLWRLFAAGIVGIGVLGLMGSQASAQLSDNASASSGAVVVSPVGLNQIASLRFGQFYAPTSGTGTVTIDAGSGFRSQTDIILAPGDILLFQDPGVGLFIAWGELGASIIVDDPADVSLVCTNCNGADMLVHLWTEFQIPDGPASVFTFREAGCGPGAQTKNCIDIKVGPTLDVAQNQASGHYQQTFFLTISYQ